MKSRCDIRGWLQGAEAGNGENHAFLVDYNYYLFFRARVVRERWSSTRYSPTTRAVCFYLTIKMQCSIQLPTVPPRKSSLWLKIHGPSDRELANKTAD